MPFQYVSSVVPCPRCGLTETECLDRLSSLAVVDYLRCPGCGNVWTIPRSEHGTPCDPKQTPA